MSKTCVICGEDCSGRPRTKDARGRYFCIPCYERAKRKQDEQHTAASTRSPEADEPSALSELLNGVLDHEPADPPPAQPPAGPASPAKPQPAGSSSPLISARLVKIVGLPVLGLIGVALVVLGDLFTSLFFVFIALAVVNGYLIGAAKIGALFGGLLAGAVVGVPMGKALEGLCSSVFQTTGATNRMLSIALCALICVVVVTVLLQFAIKRLQAQRPEWKRYDKLAGAGVGLLEGTLLGFLLIWAVLSLEPVAATSLAQTESADGTGPSNPVSRQIVSLAHAARDSTVGHIAESINPLSEIRLLTLLSKGMIVINDPGARKAFTEHPAITAIQQRPSVKQAVQMLADDPQISRIIEEQSVAENFRVILASPTLLAVFDETGIVADLTPMADGLERAIDEAMEHRAR